MVLPSRTGAASTHWRLQLLHYLRCRSYAVALITSNSDLADRLLCTGVQPSLDHGHAQLFFMRTTSTGHKKPRLEQSCLAACLDQLHARKDSYLSCWYKYALCYPHVQIYLHHCLCMHLEIVLHPQRRNCVSRPLQSECSQGCA